MMSDRVAWQSPGESETFARPGALTVWSAARHMSGRHLEVRRCIDQGFRGSRSGASWYGRASRPVLRIRLRLFPGRGRHKRGRVAPTPVPAERIDGSTILRRPGVRPPWRGPLPSLWYYPALRNSPPFRPEFGLSKGCSGGRRRGRHGVWSRRWPSARRSVVDCRDFWGVAKRLRHRTLTPASQVRILAPQPKIVEGRGAAGRRECGRQDENRQGSTEVRSTEERRACRGGPKGEGEARVILAPQPKIVEGRGAAGRRERGRQDENQLVRCRRVAHG